MSAVQGVGPQAQQQLAEQVEQIIDEARRQGASACEVAVSLEQGLSTTVRHGDVETVEFNRDQGFGVTLYLGQRKGSASTSASGAEAMGRVSMVGNDLALDSGVGTCGKDGQSVPVGVGQPTLKIDAITVGGTGA